VSFSADIRDIFARGGCASSSCHGAAVALGLDLRPGADYGSLVNVAAVEDQTKQRVLPGDAQNSYVVIKVEGRQTVGGRMPLGEAPLDSIDVATLRRWIDQGALDN
jgi:putative intracellular protease/amidase